MNRRQNRPASSEELDCWTHSAEKLPPLISLYGSNGTAENLGRINRLIASWPVDETVPAEGIDHVKSICKKLSAGLAEVATQSAREEKLIDAALEQIGILIALRKAPEMTSDKGRHKRPRAPSPVAPQPSPQRGMSITLPARMGAGSVPPIPFSREPKLRREALAAQLPLQEGRKVAFHMHMKNSGATMQASDDEEPWILAVVTKCINADKNRYEVQDPEPGESGQPGQSYNTTLRSIIPLPDPHAPEGSPCSLSGYPEFPKDSIVMALYPDTSCFYKATVVATPRDMLKAEHNLTSPQYRLAFEDDDGNVRPVNANWVVEYPG